MSDIKLTLVKERLGMTIMIFDLWTNIGHFKCFNFLIHTFQIFDRNVIKILNHDLYY